MNNVCRTCLTDGGETISILNSCNEFRNSFSYTEMVQEVASIQVSLDDGFSMLICKSCTENLEKAFAFRLQCQKSDELLRQSKINSIDIKIEEPDEYKDFYHHEIKDEFNSNKINIKTEVDVLTKIKDETIDYEEQIEPEIKTVKVNKNSIPKIKRKRKKNRDEGLNKTKIKKIKTEPSINPLKNTVDEDMTDEETTDEESTEEETTDGETTDDFSDDITESVESIKVENIKNCDHHFYELTETGEAQYPCFVCKEVFKSHVDFITHAKTHNDSKPYICRQCGNCYTNLSGLRTHYLKHKTGSSHCCEMCGKIFVKSSDLAIHMGYHKRKKTFSCPRCDKTYHSGYDLKMQSKTNSAIKLHTKK